GPRVLAFQWMLQKWVSEKCIAPLICALLLALAAPAWSADGGPIRIMAFGDSLSAGYGLDDLADSFPQQLEKALRAKGHDVVVVASAISGETTSGARSRLDWSLADMPDAVIVEFGGND